MLRERVISALFLIPLVVVIWWVGGWVFTAFVALFTAVAGWELLRMLQREPFFQPVQAIALPVILWLVAEAALPPSEQRLQLLWGMSILLALVVALFLKRQRAASDTLLSLGAALYLGTTMRFLVLLRLLPELGRQWVAVAVLITWVTDSGAYFIGRGLGRHPLWPRVSPKKTWEGWLGGLVVGTATAIILLPLFVPGMAWWQGAVVGLAVGVGGPFGDLSESLFKRQVGVKDSSHLIPGHGGFFDRIDSFIFVAPLVYALALWWA